MKVRKHLLYLLLTGLPAAAAAQSADLDFFSFEKASIEDIINIRTNVASRLDFAAREAPAIITVLTREELLNSGARNLIDALRLVPGLDFGVDVEGNLGLGIRGNWAHEGKVLVLVDGQRYNEAFFGTAQLERFSVEEIERLEVIRGPGSVIYGGSAGLGVIKITTRGAKALNGRRVAAAYGLTARGAKGGTFNFAYGRPGADYELTTQLYLAGLDRGDRRYTDFKGGSYSMKDASGLQTRSLNVGFSKSGYNARLIADIHRTQQQDHWDDSILPRPLDRNFDAYFGELSRDFRPAAGLVLTPSFNYSYQEPYNGYDATWYPRDRSSQYLKGSVNAVYALSAKARVSGGIEASLDSAKLASSAPDIFPGTVSSATYFANGKRYADYSNTAFFTEGMIELRPGTLSAGLRYDKRETFSPVFSPRLAWTKAMDNFHLKAIYSQAFRAPGIDNLTVNPALKPEKAFVTELEAGYKTGKDVYLTVDVFGMRIKDPIVFYVDGSGQHYGNYGKTGTRGFELTTKLKKDWGYADFTYSYYTSYHNEVSFYNSGGSGTLLAFARNKFTLNSSFKTSDRFSINPSAVYYSGRRGYHAAGTTKRFKDILLANTYFSCKGLAGGLDMGFGVYNILNSPYDYIQPYDGGHSPLPALSREVRIRLAYKF